MYCVCTVAVLSFSREFSETLDDAQCNAMHYTVMNTLLSISETLNCVIVSCLADASQTLILSACN